MQERETSSRSSGISGDDGPTWCGRRSRSEDAADGTLAARAHLEAMNSERLAMLVKARETATALSWVYPGGDQRFIEEESESGEEDEGIVEAVDEEACLGVLDDRVDSGPRAALDRAIVDYGFDLVGQMRDASLDFFERVKVVNYLRSVVKEGAEPKVAIEQAVNVIARREGAADLSSESWLKPVIDGDPLLTVIDDEDESDKDDQDVKATLQGKPKEENEIDEIAASIRKLLVLPKDKE